MAAEEAAAAGAGDDSGSEVEELSDAEKARVAAHFVVSSPPGQIGDVVGDVRKLVSDAAFSDAAAVASYQQYNTDNLVWADAADGTHRVIVSKDGEVDASHYIDSSAKKVFGFDHLKQTCTDETRDLTDGELDASVEEYRTAVLAALKSYIGAHYIDNGAVAVYSKDGALKVVMSCTKVNLRNKWSGSFRGWWTVADAASGSATLSGKVRVLTHYFENGNVQMHNQKDVASAPVAGADAAAVAKAVKAAVADAESTLHMGLNDMCDLMSSQTLKDIRRYLPVSGKPMEWNVNAHRMRANLVKRS